MTAYNNHFSMRDLLMNPKLAHVLPQFDRKTLKRSPSVTEIERRVAEYLKSALRGALVADREIVVRGKHKSVLERVWRLTPLLESFYSNLPNIEESLRNDSKLYTSFASGKELMDIRTFAKKMRVLKEVMDNVLYNPDLQKARGNVGERPYNYRKLQEQWKKRVGYKE